jgi:hypothetical protein
VVSCIGLAALGASVTEAPRGESASRAFGSGASLTHRPEKRQQMDLIKLIEFLPYSAHTGMTWLKGSSAKSPVATA